MINRSKKNNKWFKPILKVYSRQKTENGSTAGNENPAMQDLRDK